MKPLSARLVRPARLVAGFSAAALLSVLVQGGGACARADVIRLENGRTMHGTVDRGYVDEEALKIQLFSTGGTVRVRWEHLIEDDRDRWQVDLGLKESAEAKELKIDAQEITLVNAKKIIGLILNPEAMDSGANAEIRIQSTGKELKYPRGLLSSIVQVRVDLALIYTAEQAYEIKKAEIAPNNGKAYFDLAEYARNVGAYDQAKECYVKAKDDPIFKDQPEGRQVDSKLATLEILLRNAGLQKEIDGVRQNLREAKATRDFIRAAKDYLEARDAVFRITETVKDSVLQKEFHLVELGVTVEKERRKFFQDKLPLEVFQRVRKMMYEKAKEAKVRDFPPGLDPVKKAAMMSQGTFEGARQFASRQISEDLWAGIMKDVGASEALAAAAGTDDPNGTGGPPKKEPTPEMVEKLKRLAKMEKTLRGELTDYWTNRNKSSFNVTSYGYGSFIVVPSTLKLTRKSATGGGGGGGNRGNNKPAASQQQAVDVIKTPDQWWEGAGTKERQDWMLSWAAEHAQNLFEKMRFWDEPCESCGGLGYKKTSVAATGEEEAERCTMCNGCKVVRKVKWQ